MSYEGRIVYFDKPGQRNTAETLAIARRRADELKLDTAVLASVTGYSARLAADVFKGLHLIVVTAHTGFGTPDVQPFPADLQKELTGKGIKILTAPHVFGGLSYAMKNMFHTAMLGVESGNTLRILGQGMKVVCEIAMAACDSGLVKPGREIVSIGGTDQGVDTAVTLNPVHVADFFSLRIKEILCKPRLGGMFP